MDLLGRTEEVNILTQLYNSTEPEFLALYGRRRVGKTFLVKQFFQNKKNTIFFSATGSKDGNLEEQTSNFISRISEVFYDNLPLEKIKNWNNIFKLLTDAINKQSKNNKIIIFLDELPWMATRNSRLLQILDYYWNQYWSTDQRIKLIICGSSASWIINKVINNTGGLHNRITEKMLLEPFNLLNTKRYLESKHIILDEKQVLMLYLITGGVPYYLSKIKWKLSAMQIIEKLAFSKKSFFLDEFENLFSSLFKDHDIHIQIVKALAKHRYGIGKRRLLEMVGSAGGNSAIRLQELEDAGFIMSFKPIYHKRKGTYYRLIDEYSCFYLRWIEPIKNMLSKQALDKGDWQSMRATPEWSSWLGYSFESVCYKHLRQIKRALELPAMSIANTWRHVPAKNSNEQGTQIDLLFDRKDDAVTLCEIKFSDKEFVISKDYTEKLQKKMRVFKEQTRTKKQLFLSFIAANGLKNNLYAKEMVSEVATLEDLFKDIS